ncbi:hypothetical protein [Fontivita pretiosa]|uniref:hypothetical protein n=1 Tax=Fontivita pretiosa TaxID=2989684 RepID=UPI003D16BCC6
MSDRVVLLLVNGMSAQAAEAFAVQNGGGADEARQIVAEARKRITVAADYNRDEQIGRAVMRLDDLYAKSIAAQDIRTALQAQRELNRLLDLYAGSSRGEGASSEDATELRRQIELIASYLLPLGVADEHYPVEEHARIAAELIRRNGLAGVQGR